MTSSNTAGGAFRKGFFGDSDRLTGRIDSEVHPVVTGDAGSPTGISSVESSTEDLAAIAIEGIDGIGGIAGVIILGGEIVQISNEGNLYEIEEAGLIGVRESDCSWIFEANVNLRVGNAVIKASVGMVPNERGVIILARDRGSHAESPAAGVTCPRRGEDASGSIWASIACIRGNGRERAAHAGQNFKFDLITRRVDIEIS
ncbi:MAG: hypothetical protein ACJAVK_001943 [Akkermansiaceae bacterium]